MFEVPESDIICVRVDKQVINGTKPIEYIRAIRTNDNNDTTEQQQEQADKAKTYA